MKFFIPSTFLLSLASFAPVTVTAQLEPLLAEPTVRWSFTLSADTTTENIEYGNGVFMAPDGKTALVGTVGASVYAFDAFSGEQKWSYMPEVIGTSITRSHSAIISSPDESYMVYSVVDNENSFTPTTRVIALDMDGNELWISDTLEGIPAGSPQVSSDGMYVYLTHNTMSSSLGYFTILDASAGGLVWYSEPSMGDGNDTAAFAPVGIYHMPVEGNYDPIGGDTSPGAVSEGEFNTNDMIMWCQQPKPSDTSIQDGYMYGFQFPRDFSGNLTDVAYFQLGTFIRDQQSTTAPVMTNGGLSAYWSVTRSSSRAWASKRFSRARDGAAGFTRNTDFPGASIFSMPAVSNDGPEPFVFFGTASTEFVRMNFDYSEQILKGTDSIIMASPKVDGEERVVYWVEENGFIHQDDFELAQVWNYTVNFFVEGEMALTPKSDVLIVADTRGVITALQVAEIPDTFSPSDFPSDMPSMAPSGPETAAPVGPPVAPIATPPTDAPVAPVVAPTTAPGTPTTAPVVVPTAAPVDAPTSAPSAAFGKSLFVATGLSILAAVLMI